MKIFLDSGHNYSGVDTGAEGNGLREQDITYQVAQKLGTLLLNIGIDVKYSREKITDSVGTTLNSSISGRYTKANIWNADYFISLHCDSASSSSRGSHICIYSKGGKAEQLANSIQSHLLPLGLDGRSEQISVRTDLGVLRNSNMPAVLIEMGFISNKDNAHIQANRQDDLANAIFKGICEFIGYKEQGGETLSKEILPKTVMTFNNIHMQILELGSFRIEQCDKRKKDINEVNYFNLGYFAQNADGSTIPVGNLVIDGNIITQAKGQADWLNTANKQLTTLIIHNDNSVTMDKVDSFDGMNVKFAVSGIPIIRNGYRVDMKYIKAEGYFGYQFDKNGKLISQGELYDTWHGFLGIRYGKPIYVAAKCEFDMMVYILEYLGIKDACKVDGGGSFILVNGNQVIESTDENRRINNIGIWS